MLFTSPVGGIMLQLIVVCFIPLSVEFVFCFLFCFSRTVSGGWQRYAFYSGLSHLFYFVTIHYINIIISSLLGILVMNVLSAL